MGGGGEDLDEFRFRAENCRRVAAEIGDPEVMEELLALAKHYDEIADRLQKAAEEAAAAKAQKED